MCFSFVCVSFVCVSLVCFSFACVCRLDSVREDAVSVGVGDRTGAGEWAVDSGSTMCDGWGGVVDKATWFSSEWASSCGVFSA